MPIKRIAFAVAFILLGAISASAQTDPNLEQGIKPFGAYDSSDTDSISMVNGGLTLNIPLFRYSQRGSKLSLDFSDDVFQSGLDRIQYSGTSN